jgi:hypothetical protein
MGERERTKIIINKKQKTKNKKSGDGERRERY